MGSIHLLLAAASLLAVQALPAAEPQRPRPPTFPPSYHVAYNFTLPYERLIQEGGLTMDVKVWRDHKSIRMDTYNSSNILVQTSKHTLEVTPRIDRLSCLKYEPDADDSILNAPILPDLHAGWEFRGSQELHGSHVLLWELEQWHGPKHTVYKFYVDSEGQPRRLHMHGNDMFSGAHFDKWIADYTAYSPGVDTAAFEVPAVCQNASLAQSRPFRSFPLRMKAYLPLFAFSGDEAYDQHLAVHGRLHATQADYDARAQIFQANRQLVGSSNASYSVALNQYADWSQEEFEAVMLPKRRQPEPSNKVGSGSIPYERKVPAGGPLPRQLDWRHEGPGFQVKDQAACGSCWAFGVAGMLQGAFWLATGKQASFSEQQLVDCSWDFGNNACDGGDWDWAGDYLANASGIAFEKDYTYKGANGFCKDNRFVQEPLTRFKGYAAVPTLDDEAMMEALFSRGPIAITIDASQPGFRFYSDGLYESPTCAWKQWDLDHIVTLVGYGTTAEGKDYWLMRNSWSRHWGNHGYMKMARGPKHDCGVTTAAAYAVFE